MLENFLWATSVLPYHIFHARDDALRVRDHLEIVGFLSFVAE